ncbi:MAG TPA: 2-acylglycerophosphoethanolamine acyltransferase, partial [Alphaproteobacteria bacterium]|nr:2-acylglycerophosphoethanolamine acyltransferase [Alphaproteobacteria bacterium]
MNVPARHLPFNQKNAEKNVVSALLDARNTYGGKRQIMIDGDERVMTYDDILRAAFALGSAIRKHTKRGENVGVLLPTGVGAVITFFA